jgi:hypothetical protein
MSAGAVKADHVIAHELAEFGRSGSRDVNDLVLAKYLSNAIGVPSTIRGAGGGMNRSAAEAVSLANKNAVNMYRINSISPFAPNCI